MKKLTREEKALRRERRKENKISQAEKKIFKTGVEMLKAKYK